MQHMNAEQSKIYSQIVTHVESGLTPQEIINKFQEEDLHKQHSTDEPTVFPDEIKLIAQALAFRKASEEDIPVIHTLLNSAYQVEVVGEEAFRAGPAVSVESIYDLFSDDSYTWLLVEVPCGKGVIEDGTLLGVCCFSMDGVARRNGEVEGHVGAFRYFGVLPRYQGLLIGQRLLSKAESIMQQHDCVRVMSCVAVSRENCKQWLTRRGYVEAQQIAYPSVGHELVKDVKLCIYHKALAKQAANEPVIAKEAHLPPIFRGLSNVASTTTI